ncbi:MAG: diphthamide biosynthesis enzyme Dph2 [Candidatus Methanomethyliaceae archaeon]|nr:diphthamide biosynthesis enzyme Dph2 [Candidatus Methanomethyliaceae archaeon]MDW7970457.1 diphthamide biosynthesis enzyme Dph2 [Nitrososphaerota archaeon]
MNNIVPYDFEVERLRRELKDAKNIFIQAPDGLKPYLIEVLKALSSKNIIISTDPCYGGCYILDDIAKEIGSDAIIHFGHEKFIEKEKIPTIYIKCTYIGSLEDLIRKTKERIMKNNYKNVAIFTNAQHIDVLEKFIDSIRTSNINVINGGLVLGCRMDKVKEVSNSMDAIFYLGGGDFHALGISLEIEKPVYVIDPYRNEIREISAIKKKVIAEKWWTIHRAKDAKILGIVIVARKGQFNMDIAMKLKTEFEKVKRNVVLLIAEEVNWERLAPFTFIDAFIITGCPRIALDNRETFYKPVLNIEEAFELLKVIKK